MHIRAAVDAAPLGGWDAPPVDVVGRTVTGLTLTSIVAEGRGAALAKVSEHYRDRIVTFEPRPGIPVGTVAAALEAVVGEAQQGRTLHGISRFAPALRTATVRRTTSTRVELTLARHEPLLSKVLGHELTTWAVTSALEDRGCRVPPGCWRVIGRDASGIDLVAGRPELTDVAKLSILVVAHRDQGKAFSSHDIDLTANLALPSPVWMEASRSFRRMSPTSLTCVLIGGGWVTSVELDKPRRDLADRVTALCPSFTSLRPGSVWEEIVGASPGARQGWTEPSSPVRVFHADFFPNHEVCRLLVGDAASVVPLTYDDYARVVEHDRSEGSATLALVDPQLPGRAAALEWAATVTAHLTAATTTTRAAVDRAVQCALWSSENAVARRASELLVRYISQVGAVVPLLSLRNCYLSRLPVGMAAYDEHGRLRLSLADATL